MAIGTISKGVLTGIANAIRAQNGSAETYLPSEMASAVAALDGTSAGSPLQKEAEAGTGILPASVFSGIAGEIRVQNGSSETYKPGEMAAAILSLSWEAEPKMRALLLSDGTLEFNCRAGVSSDSVGAEIVSSWEVPAAGFAAAGARGWHAVRQQVKRAVFDADFSGGGLASAAWLFDGCSALIEVWGFEELAGVPDFTRTFAGCSSLESVYCAAGADFSAATGAAVLYGCPRLVGGSGFVPENSDGTEVLCHGTEGVLTDPAADARAWFSCFLYADGELVLTATTVPETGRTVLSSGRMCAQARYRALGCRPWGTFEDDVTAATIAADMAAFPCVNMDYWFYGHSSLASVAGLSHLGGTREMRYAFSSCTSLASIDLSGFDESALEDVFYCFSGCSSLATVLADASWELPEGCAGAGAFYGCTSLVGGAGTVYDASRISAEYLRIDGGETAPGYLTAKA